MIPTTEKIYSSLWWEEAVLSPDKHYQPGSGKVLAGHLTAVMENARRIFEPVPVNKFYQELYLYLSDAGFEMDRCREILIVTALMHDLGKPLANKDIETEHPLRKISVPKRHAVMGVYAAIDILDGQEDFSDIEKYLIYNLIDEHDTPFSWYRQYIKTGVIPEPRSWKRLDHKIGADRIDQYGIIMLALFKLADVDGHESIADVIWFWENLNDKYLDNLGKSLPIPLETDIRSERPGNVVKIGD